MPNQTKILRKDKLHGLLERLVRECLVMAPLRKGSLVLMGRIHAPDEVVLDYGTTKESPKSALFPQRETLFTYRSERGKMEVDVPRGEEKGQVLFGIRPCDARGLLLLDQVFCGGCSDPYYAGKRANTLVVSLGCEAPKPTCFCLSTGGGPCSAEGSDVFLLNLGDRYAAEAVTERGAAFLEERAFEDGDEETLALARQVKERADASMKNVADMDPLEADLELLFNDPVWSDLAESCLGCGICTYLCPTCHCFDLCDEGAGMTGERIRIWDSCQFPLFTQQASGFNPRPTGKERFRQRIMHKFSYLPESQARLGCVGCGRCVTECPVNLDIREVITILSRRSGR
ncbi:MAG: 4Fe-4S dicluster domain-containing protein [Deltaproteobacteria bacterium]|nr:4Fe-4S dicluster domain-containing protein [Deltaproteobacteria bacterium]